MIAPWPMSDWYTLYAITDYPSAELLICMEYVQSVITSFVLFPGMFLPTH